ncbi:MAG: type II toxin-antitoxin system HicA family toxin [Cellvibrionaceae bacterium]
MPKGFYKEVAKLLKDNGCVQIRSGSGSHEVWKSPATNQHITVSSNLKSRHTANAVLKDAGINKKL